MDSRAAEVAEQIPNFYHFAFFATPYFSGMGFFLWNDLVKNQQGGFQTQTFRTTASAIEKSKARLAGSENAG
jgi:hypothetical protein